MKVLFAFFLVSALYAQNVDPEKIYRTGQSISLEDFKFLKADTIMIAWTDGIMLTTDLNKVIRDTIYISSGNKDFELALADTTSIDSQQEPCIGSESYFLQSIVGNFVSTGYSYYFEGPTHSYFGSYTKVYPLINIRSSHYLFELFDEQDVVAALKDHPIIKSHFSSLRCENFRACLDSLYLQKNQVGNEDFACASFEDLTKNFYIFNYSNGMAHVGFDLSPDAGCHYGQNFSFNLKIKVRKDKEKVFKKMMKDKTSFKFLSKK